MVEQAMRLDPVTRYVRGLDGDYLLSREAAQELGITNDRLKLLGRKDPDNLGPGYVAWMGEVKIYLYDKADLDQIRAYFARLAAKRSPALDRNRSGRGRPAVWTAAEHASRHRRRALARYHLLAAAHSTEKGNTAQAERNAARHRELQDELDAQRARRDAQLNA